MMVNVPHVTPGLGLRKFQADGFLLTRVYKRLGEPQGRCGRMRKISPSSGVDPRTVQPVTSRCIVWAIPVDVLLYACTELTSRRSK